MKLTKRYKEIILYIVFGILTTAVSWGSYSVFVTLCNCSVALGNALSWICSMVFAFVTNKIWVFESKEWAGKVLLKEISTFVTARLLTGVIELAGVPLLEKTGFDTLFTDMFRKLHLSYPILFTKGIYSKISFAVIIVILNYVFSKLIVFKNAKKKEENCDSQKNKAE